MHLRKYVVQFDMIFLFFFLKERSLNPQVILKWLYIFELRKHKYSLGNKNLSSVEPVGENKA